MSKRLSRATSFLKTAVSMFGPQIKVTRFCRGITPNEKSIIKLSLCALLIVSLSTSVAVENSSVRASQDIVAIPDPVLKSYLSGVLGQPSSSNIIEAQMQR